MTEEKPRTQTIRPAGIPSEEAVGPPTVWLAYSFAPEWFADALAEARSSDRPSSTRREIVFAVCAAEAYLVEWVRDDVLRHDLSDLNAYFPPGKRIGVTQRWKEVTKQLHADGKIAAVPSWEGHEWRDFVELVHYRDGLVHARSSRPETAGLSKGELPFPTVAQLASCMPGWATTTLVRLIEHVHQAISTAAPTWLELP